MCVGYFGSPHSELQYITQPWHFLFVLHRKIIVVWVCTKLTDRGSQSLLPPPTCKYNYDLLSCSDAAIPGNSEFNRISLIINSNLNSNKMHGRRIIIIEQLAARDIFNVFDSGERYLNYSLGGSVYKTHCSIIYSWIPSASPISCFWSRL